MDVKGQGFGKRIIFISHSSKDKEEVKKLAAFLRKVCDDRYRGKYEVYFAPEELSKSIDRSSVVSQIVDKINRAACFIVYYTPNAVFSRWVHFEIGIASNRLNEIKFIPFVKCQIDSSSTLNNIPRIDIESNDSIESLLCRVFDINPDDESMDWLKEYSDEIDSLHYTLKSKRVYIVGSKALLKGGAEGGGVCGAQDDSEQSNFSLYPIG